MAAHIGTITGTALVPGVSRNGRLYTAEAIGRAVDRARQRLTEGLHPLTMLTHHAADDDSTHIVGRITAIEQAPDGSATYTAVLADTPHARDIASLVDTRDGPPFLRGVSIRGAWVGKVRREQGPDGSLVETADDLELDGLDFTRKPGVPGARVDRFTPATESAAESDTGRVLITESVQEALVQTPATEAEASSTEGPFADPGYQKDGKKRYPIGSKSQAKAAWSYVNQADNARAYTSAQLKRIKARIIKALKSYGVTVAAQEGWLIDPATAIGETLAECWDMAPGGGSLYVSLTNGPTTVTVSSALLDAHDLDAVGRAAMAGACQALLALDPDMDADIDVPGAEPEDTDHGMDTGEDDDTDDDAMETATDPADTTEADETTPATPTPAQPAPAADPTPTKEESAMAETTNTAAETTPAADLSDAAIDRLADKLSGALAAAFAQFMPAPVAAAESAPAEQVAETAPAEVAEVAESDEQRLQRLVAEGIAAALPQAVQEHVEKQGPPARKGLIDPVTENAPAPAGASALGIPEGWPQKPLHEYSPEEWAQYVAPTTVGTVLGARAAQ